MKLLVTGGSGFIGGHVLRALREAGHEVVNVDLTGDDARQHDITDLEQMTALFESERPEQVFHIAGVADARRALQEPAAAVSTNIGGTASILEAARRTGVKRVHLASTCWVGNAMGSGLLDEEAPFKAEGGGHVYTTTKIASELLAHDFNKLYGQAFTVLRYGIPYGPGMWPGLVLRAFLDRAFKGEPLTIFGDGSAARRFVFVEDLARAHVLALQDVAQNQVYNLEGMRFVTIKELASLVSELMGGIEVSYREEPTRIGEFQYYRKLISSNKAYMELGWEATVDLREGVERTIAWYREQLAE